MMGAISHRSVSRLPHHTSVRSVPRDHTHNPTRISLLGTEPISWHRRSRSLHAFAFIWVIMIVRAGERKWLLDVIELGVWEIPQGAGGAGRVTRVRRKWPAADGRWHIPGLGSLSSGTSNIGPRQVAAPQPCLLSTSFVYSVVMSYSAALGWSWAISAGFTDG